MGFFLGNCVGKRFGVDEIDVSADAAQIAHGPGDGCLKRAVVPPVDVFFEIDVAIGWVNSIMPHGVSKVPGEPVVMQVSAVVICEIAPASDNLLSRLT